MKVLTYWSYYLDVFEELGIPLNAMSLSGSIRIFWQTFEFLGVFHCFLTLATCKSEGSRSHESDELSVVESGNLATEAFLILSPMRKKVKDMHMCCHMCVTLIIWRTKLAKKVKFPSSFEKAMLIKIELLMGSCRTQQFLSSVLRTGCGFSPKFFRRVA